MIRIEIASGATVESRVRALSRYLEARRKTWPIEELASFPAWAEEATKRGLANLARDAYPVES